LLLGLELTGFPFLAALKQPNGFDSIEEAIPEGFNERVKGKGVVYGSWIQQQLILEHPSVGCFITHCGAALITEGLVNTCQLVLLPRIGSDHIINARMMSDKFKVGVEVEKGKEDGLFTKESVCRAVKIVIGMIIPNFSANIILGIHHNINCFRNNLLHPFSLQIQLSMPYQ
jgi:hypothetical protein